ncbi:MAG: hypothetical protein QOE33_3387 [Acidobacteriota bacterium]|nr:hypothetical protein [Acidobacteriota bacterium]
MRSIKIIAFALVLGLTGAVYAAGLTQDATHTHATAKPDCCKMHMAGDKKSAAAAHDTCDMKDGGCCKAHAEKSQANAHAAGCDCCSGGCCQMHKEHASTAKVAANSGGDTPADSCASADCCKDCACCKAHHAAASEATADKESHQGCCASCRMAHGAGH